MRLFLLERLATYTVRSAMEVRNEWVRTREVGEGEDVGGAAARGPRGVAVECRGEMGLFSVGVGGRLTDWVGRGRGYLHVFVVAELVS